MTYRRNCGFRVEDSERDLSAQFIEMDEQFFTPTMMQYSNNNSNSRRQKDEKKPRPMSMYASISSNNDNNNDDDGGVGLGIRVSEFGT